MSLDIIFLTIQYYIKNVFLLFWNKMVVAFTVGIWGYILLTYNAQTIASNALICLMITDFLLGFYSAMRSGRLSSWRMKMGIGKFFTYMLIVVSGYGFDMLVFKQHMEWGVHYFFIVYLGINELLSIGEHTSELGVKLPFIKNLKKIQKNLEEKELKDLIIKLQEEGKKQ